MSPVELISADNDAELCAWLGVAPSTGQVARRRRGSDERARDPNAYVTNKEGGMTEEHILAVAARAGAVKCARALIAAGSDVNHAGTNGVTVRIIVNTHDVV